MTEQEFLGVIEEAEATGYAGLDQDDIGAIVKLKRKMERRGIAPKRPTGPPPTGGYALAAAQELKKRRLPFGMDSISFVNGGATSLTATLSPTEPVELDRLIMERVNIGAAAPGLEVKVTSIKVGLTELMRTGKPGGISCFARDATDSDVDFPTISIEHPLNIVFTISAAPAAMESVRVEFSGYNYAVLA